MENNQPQQSVDKSQTGEMENSSSTSSKPKPKDPFLSLPSDVLVKIIGYTPVAQWPSLELVDKNFRAATWIAWRQLRNVDLDRDFVMKPESETDGSSIGNYVSSILQKLNERSPFLSSLSVIEEVNSSNVIQVIAQFEHLQLARLGDASWNGRDRDEGTSLEYLVEFLESTQSRTNLKELKLFNVKHREEDSRSIRHIVRQWSRIQPSLTLEKFTFSSPGRSLNIRLDTMDTSRLTDVRLGKAWIEPDQLTVLIERALNLREIELRFLECPGYHCGYHCNGPRLQANKKLLMALASRENLTAIKLENFGGDIQCTNFGHELIEMLKTIGRRGKLRKLSLSNYDRPPTVDMDEVCGTICIYLSYLQSIKLNIDFLSDESMVNIVSLTQLEEIFFDCFHQRSVSSSVVEKIGQLQRLNRLALNIYNDAENMTSFDSLAGVTTLRDLRIGDAKLISTDAFEKWANGFGSNLQSLMVWGITEKDQNVEEGLIRLLKKAVNLSVLMLRNRVSARLLSTIAQSCPKLEMLGVETTWNKIAIQHLQDIVDRCPKLRKLGERHTTRSEKQLRNRLRIPKYRKIGVVDAEFYYYDFDDKEYE